jgi:soluble lytic murein transglycosylase-like protein
VKTVGVLTLPDELARWDEFVRAAAAKHQVKESLIYAHMSRESGGRNVRGDSGHGRGLMQIDDRAFSEWVKRNSEGMDPASNIDKGAEVIRDNIDFWERHASLLPVLADPAFRERCAIASYNCGAGMVLRAVHAGQDPDHYTAPGPTGHPDYSADVLRRQKSFLKEQP